jgi:hypothetical protein
MFDGFEIQSDLHPGIAILQLLQLLQLLQVLQTHHMVLYSSPRISSYILIQVVHIDVEDEHTTLIDSATLKPCKRVRTHSLTRSVTLALTPSPHSIHQLYLDCPPLYLLSTPPTYTTIHTATMIVTPPLMVVQR